MLSTSSEDRPLGVQLLGNDPDMIKRALDIISGYDFDVIDFNAACPASKVVSKDKGAGLLRNPAKLQSLLKAIVESTDRPVTVKLRSGWDEASINAVETALRAQDAGVKGVFIHGRTKMQRYSGTVDYKVIKEVKESLKIPVIASGDGLTPVLIQKLFDETGCGGVAIARGALGNPWIFRETAGYMMSKTIPPRPDIYEITETMKKHLDLNVAYNGEARGVIRFRKFFPWYLRGMPVKNRKAQAFRACTRDEMIELIDEVKSLLAA
jgi:nifR3 family TIM-barrel protein